MPLIVIEISIKTHATSNKKHCVRKGWCHIGIEGNSGVKSMGYSVL